MAIENDQVSLKMKQKIYQAILVLILLLFPLSNVFAQYIPHITDSNRYELHFSHPLNAESISPDTHARLDYSFSNLGNNATQNGFNVEMEYAITPAFSFSASLPYQILNPAHRPGMAHTDNLELSFKFANYTFATHHVLLGYGFNFDLPTGSTQKGIGSSNVLGLSPFFDMGYMWHRWEWVGFATFDIPTGQKNPTNVQNGLNLQFATVYHVTHNVQGIFEAQRTCILNGINACKDMWYLTEGAKITHIKNSPITLGLGVREPLTKLHNFNFQGLVSVFYDI